MPLFEYQCRECGSRFERIVVSHATPVACKNCNSSKVEKLISVFAVAGSATKAAASEPGPCPCGAPRRGMCGE